MALTEYVKLTTFAVLAIFAVGIIKTILELRKSPRSDGKRVFVNDRQEYLSVWEIAHQWESMDPIQTDRENVPTEIKQCINRLLLAYFRKELALRKPNGYRLLGHHWLHVLLFVDNQYEKLWADLNNDKLDVQLLDCLFVRRGEILQWCAKEFIEPPPCWAPPSATQQATQTHDDGDEDMRWYKEMSELRRRKTACLELAQHIWKHEGPLAYEAVRTHLLMKQVGLLNVFTPGGFKKAARDFAPEKVKLGGRPRETST